MIPKAISVNPSSVFAYRNPDSMRLGVAGIPLHELVPTSVMAARSLAGIVVDSQSLIHDFLQSHPQKGLIVDKLNELVMDIKSKGVLNAITGYKFTSGFEVTDGTHRTASACMLGLDKIPAINLPIDPFTVIPPAVEVAYDKARTKLNFPNVYNPLGSYPSRRQGWNRLSIIYDEIAQLHGQNLLELGCFDGFFGTFLSTRCFDVTFVDVCDVAIDLVKAKMDYLLTNPIPGFPSQRPDSKYNFVLGDAPEWLETTDQMFDVIICTDAFYHMFGAGQADKADAILGNCLKHCCGKMLFCPGPWPALNSKGWNETRMWNVIRNHGKTIRYLGAPPDRKSYEGRELYCIS